MATQTEDDLLKPGRDAFVEAYMKDMSDRLEKMTEPERVNFMSWFVGEKEAKVLARKMRDKWA